MAILLIYDGDKNPIFWPEIGKKGSSWFSSVKKVFKPSPKELQEKKVIFQVIHN